MENLEFVEFEVEDGVAWIKLNKPPLNILDIKMLEELTKALKEADKRNDVFAICIKASEKTKAFSAGADVRDHMPDRLKEFIDAFNNVFYTMWSIEKPIISAVRGYALGGGCEILLASDVVIAASDSKIGQPEITVGVYPPVAVVLMPLLAGYQRAAELILTGEMIDAEKAEKIGLVNKVVKADELDSAVREFLGKLGDKSSAVLKITKRALYQSIGIEELKQKLETVTETYMNDLMKTEDASEGLKAFMEKRKPVWKGR